MKYINSTGFTHKQNDKIGVLITNLGTPDEPTPKALKRYLKQFLSDPRVVEVPKLIWWTVLNGIILNIRPRRSAKAYRTVWTNEGSPLLTITQQQTAALRLKLIEKYGDNIVVDFAMRYGSPAIDVVTNKMLDQGVRKLIVLPLYPQYCASTTGSTFDAIASLFTRRRWLPDFRFINAYHDHPSYIEALATSVRQHWEKHGKADKLIFSFHGIPKRYLTNGDPYFCHCHKTSRLLAASLGINEQQYETTFQSRFGREEWLQPYTDFRLKALPGEGIKSIQVVCPGFSADCLETLEEIAVENRDYFMEAGGKRYEYIPALNAHANHIAALTTIIEQNIQGWRIDNELSLRSELSKKHGATQ
ncbi:ferrochelatase [Alteromonas sp. ASW11-130]|uniref:ferrochelatase n=1 Tax=Alteromonas sp. ASW11-130 TaxID=3015775 RepID=UPI0022423189|nr:ferrochelatase [Alteromonas sp. ASW11-130]MCW8090766.1 ferrochelatase [Alteromonas sp. ASW11-130]